MKSFRIAFTFVIVFGFLVLDWAGLRIYLEKPPVSDSVITQIYNPGLVQAQKVNVQFEVIQI